MFKVMVVGAYGNFGSIICHQLARETNIQLILNGRDSEKLYPLLDSLANSKNHQMWTGDAMTPAFEEALIGYQVDLVIHTAGPFQGQSYSIAKSCIAQKVNYCDLADCRTFVGGIHILDEQARSAGVAILSGCSSVPSLSSAVIDQYREHFLQIHSIHHGISSSSKMPGLSTIEGVLKYAGKPITQLKSGAWIEVRGWMGLRIRKMRGGLGYRLLANVDVTDMDIFAQRFGATTLTFQAGAGLKLGGLANYLLALGVSKGLIKDPKVWAKRLHQVGKKFEPLGDGKSAMFIEIQGLDVEARPVTLEWQLSAYRDKGPMIPSCASIALAIKMARGYVPESGARACVGDISLNEYLQAIGPGMIQVESHWLRPA